MTCVLPRIMSSAVKESIALTGGLSPMQVAADCPGLPPCAAQAALVHCEAMQVRKWFLREHGSDLKPLLTMMMTWDGTAMRQETLDPALAASGQGPGSTASGQDSGSTASGQHFGSTASGQEVVWEPAVGIIQKCCTFYGSLKAIPRRPVRIPLSLLQPAKLLGVFCPAAAVATACGQDAVTASGQDGASTALGLDVNAEASATATAATATATAVGQAATATAFGQALRKGLAMEQDGLLEAIFAWLPPLQRRFGAANGFRIVGEAVHAAAIHSGVLRAHCEAEAAEACVAWGASMIALDEAGVDYWDDVFTQSPSWRTTQATLSVMMMARGSSEDVPCCYAGLHELSHMTG